MASLPLNIPVQSPARRSRSGSLPNIFACAAEVSPRQIPLSKRSLSYAISHVEFLVRRATIPRKGESQSDYEHEAHANNSWSLELQVCDYMYDLQWSTKPCEPLQGKCSSVHSIVRRAIRMQFVGGGQFRGGQAKEVTCKCEVDPRQFVRVDA